VDAYVEAQKQLPSRRITLETKTNTYFHFKTDIFKEEISYSTDKTIAANVVTISAERAFEVINLNKRGIKPDSLEVVAKNQTGIKQESHDILGDNVNRFDAMRKKKKKRHGNPYQNIPENPPPQA
jgi:hypothetical protein